MSATDSGIVIPPEIAGRQPQQPIPPETPLTVTLTAAEWNLVQQALQALMQPVRSVSDKLARQVFAEAYGNPPTMEQQP